MRTAGRAGEIRACRMLRVVVTLAPFYGRGIQWPCIESQHMGLPGNVPAFRLCSRTIYLNRVL